MLCSCADVAAPDLSHIGSVSHCAAATSISGCHASCSLHCRAAARPCSHCSPLRLCLVPLPSTHGSGRVLQKVPDCPRQARHVAHAARFRLSNTAMQPDPAIAAAANCSRYMATCELGWRSAALTISNPRFRLTVQGYQQFSPHSRCCQTCDGCRRNSKFGGPPLVLPFHLCSKLWPHWGCHGVPGASLAPTCC